MSIKLSIIVLLTALLTGCGTLIPKRVELFQDKVEKFPEAGAKERETQRQAAQRAADVAKKALISAVTENASTNVTKPIGEAARVSDSVSRSLGPPLRPSTDPSDELAQKLDSSVAKLNSRIDEFKQDNNVNAGKKIEGTGLFQIPYFLWIGLVAIFIFAGLLVAGVLWSFLKMFALSNPPVALGVNALQTGGKFAAKAVGQLIKGGEKFKDAIGKEISDPALVDKIRSLFTASHKEAQDGDVKTAVDQLTK